MTAKLSNYSKTVMLLSSFLLKDECRTQLVKCGYTNTSKIIIVNYEEKIKDIVSRIDPKSSPAFLAMALHGQIHIMVMTPIEKRENNFPDKVSMESTIGMLFEAAADNQGNMFEFTEWGLKDETLIAKELIAA